MTPIPATGRNSYFNSVHNSPGTLFLSHSSNNRFLNEGINVINFVLAKKAKTPIPATSRNSHSNSEHN